MESTTTTKSSTALIADTAHSNPKHVPNTTSSSIASAKAPSAATTTAPAKRPPPPSPLPDDPRPIASVKRQRTPGADVTAVEPTAPMSSSAATTPSVGKSDSSNNTNANGNTNVAKRPRPADSAKSSPPTPPANATAGGTSGGSTIGAGTSGPVTKRPRRSENSAGNNHAHHKKNIGDGDNNNNKNNISNSNSKNHNSAGAPGTDKKRCGPRLHRNVPPRTTDANAPGLSKRRRKSIEWQQRQAQIKARRASLEKSNPRAPNAAASAPTGAGTKPKDSASAQRSKPSASRASNKQPARPHSASASERPKQLLSSTPTSTVCTPATTATAAHAGAAASAEKDAEGVGATKPTPTTPTESHSASGAEKRANPVVIVVDDDDADAGQTTDEQPQLTSAKSKPVAKNKPALEQTNAGDNAHAATGTEATSTGQPGSNSKSVVSSSRITASSESGVQRPAVEKRATEEVVTATEQPCISDEKRNLDVNDSVPNKTLATGKAIPVPMKTPVPKHQPPPETVIVLDDDSSSHEAATSKKSAERNTAETSNAAPKATAQISASAKGNTAAQAAVTVTAVGQRKPIESKARHSGNVPPRKSTEANKEASNNVSSKPNTEEPANTAVPSAVKDASQTSAKKNEASNKSAGLSVDEGNRASEPSGKPITPSERKEPHQNTNISKKRKASPDGQLEGSTATKVAKHNTSELRSGAKKQLNVAKHQAGENRSKPRSQNNKVPEKSSAAAEPGKSNHDKPYNRKKRVQDGSYRAYYSRRDNNPSAENDKRLPLIRNVIASYSYADVLDIGCNDGSLTLQVARSKGVGEVTGLDLDEQLVQSARRTVREMAMYAHKSQPLEKQEKPTDTTVKKRIPFPFNILFRNEDFAAEKTLPCHKAEQFDVVLCLSVTKWIHFKHGDDGIRRLFSGIFKVLRPGGCLVLEPQPSKSYKQARQKGLAPRDKTFTQLKIRPDQFDDILCDEVGFGRMEILREIQPGHHEFNRQVIAFYKLKEGELPTPRPVKGRRAKKAAKAQAEQELAEKEKVKNACAIEGNESKKQLGSDKDAEVVATQPEKDKSSQPVDGDTIQSTCKQVPESS